MEIAGHATGYDCNSTLFCIHDDYSSFQKLKAVTHTHSGLRRDPILSLSAHPQAQTSSFPQFQKQPLKANHAIWPLKDLREKYYSSADRYFLSLGGGIVVNCQKAWCQSIIKDWGNSCRHQNKYSMQSHGFDVWTEVFLWQRWFHILSRKTYRKMLVRCNLRP